MHTNLESYSNHKLTGNNAYNASKVDPNSQLFTKDIGKSIAKNCTLVVMTSSW